MLGDPRVGSALVLNVLTLTVGDLISTEDERRQQVAGYSAVEFPTKGRL
jgi:hypothetical protein